MATVTSLEKNQYGSNPLLISMASIHQMMSVLRDHIRELYYRAVLFARPCTDCGRPDMDMVRDSWCRCRSCGQELDPTAEFQDCPECHSRLSRRVYHYWCDHCRMPVRSMYCFDAKVFDAAYFREMMRESRERRRQRHEQIKQMLAQSRSGPLLFGDDPSLDTVPGLEAALNDYLSMPIPLTVFMASKRPRFEMNLYRQHILELASGCVVHFGGISRLLDDSRLDKIFRFITIIFMQHDGEIEITQDYTGEILLRRR